MDEQLKRRLVGATVLVALAIIFLPMLLEHQPGSLKPLPVEPMPKEPPRRFDTSLLQEPASTPPGADVKPKPEKREPAAKQTGKKTASATPHGSAGTAHAPGKAATPSKKSVSAPKPRPASPSAWVVRVASLSSRENAMKLVKKLRGAGLDTMDPRPVTVKGKRFYRVQVGPEVSKKNAERHLKLIEKVTGIKGQVVRYP